MTSHPVMDTANEIRKHNLQVAVQLLAACVVVSRVQITVATDYCVVDIFNASCPHGEVIMMQSARYGRMRAGSCITHIDHSMGCVADVLPTLDRKCSGRRQCNYPVTNLITIASPCDVNFMTYLEANFTCVKATSTDPACLKHKTVRLTEQQGYIVHGPSSPRGRSAHGCSYHIELDQDQTIQMKAYNFIDSSDDSPSCRDVNLQEKDSRKTLSVCRRAHQRAPQIYESLTNRVSVQFTNQHTGSDGVLLLHYKAIGCPRLKSPEGGHVIQNGKEATVKCNATQETWFLTCKGNTWLGEPDNCTGGAPHPSATALSDESPFPFGILIAVLIGVVLGVLIGSFLLGVVFLCIKGKRPVTRGPPGGVPVSEFSLEDSRGNYPSLLQGKPAQSPLPGEYCYGYGARLPPGQGPAFKQYSYVEGENDIRDGANVANTDKEHVYESANFGRHGSLRPGELLPVYYELDKPENAPVDNQFAHPGHHSN